VKTPTVNTLQDLCVPAASKEPWVALSQTESAKRFVAAAAALLAEPLPETCDDFFLDYTRNGDRSRWQNVNFKRRSRISLFPMAERLDGHGRFVAPFEEAVAAVCAEKTWVMPAHDCYLENFRGFREGIDLCRICPCASANRWH